MNWLTPEEVGKLVKVSAKTVLNWCHKEKDPLLTEKKGICTGSGRTTSGNGGTGIMQSPLNGLRNWLI